MIRNTLAARIIAMSGIWIVLALLVTALLLVHLYREHIKGHFDAHVITHLEELVAASSISADGALELSSYPSDPRFYALDSGWYWEIRQSGRTLERSQSLGDGSLNVKRTQSSEGILIHEITGPREEKLRAQTMKVRFGANHEPLMFLASAPLMSITDDVWDFAEHTLLSFLVLGAGLLFAVVLQVRIALKPLHTIGDEISDVREGAAQKLSRDYPVDVQPLVDELNNLLEHNSVLVKRARNQLGDLAHSVKNPLTVISNEARNMEPDQKRLILQQTGDIANSVEHHLSRARAIGAENVLGTRACAKSAVEDLAFVMQRLYQDRNLKFDFSGMGNCLFRGEAQDLEEMLGNLFDNASKWANSRVIVHCKTNAQRLLLTVEDDGPGIPEDQIDKVLQRGQKLDQDTPGHGLGLAIIKDIAALYGGTLTISRSGYGGVRAELNLPGANPGRS